MEIKPVYGTPAPIAHTLRVSEEEACRLTGELINVTSTRPPGIPMLARLLEMLQERNR